MNKFLSIGEYQAFKISDINKIFPTLIKRLYPEPLKSSLIEIISNAYDSHVASNKINKPIFLTLTPENVLVIKDTGLGMSHEFMMDKYMDVGYSTKSEDLNQLGRFGLGRLSILSYVSYYTVTSIYNGEKRKYSISYNEDSLPSMIYDEDIIITDEENGVTVEYKIKSEDIYKLKSLIKENLLYFDNIIINVDSIKNDYTIYEYQTFKTSDFYHRNLALLNGVTIFPIKEEYINEKYKFLLSHSALLKFDIMENLDPAPDRSNIIWHKENIKKVNDKLEKYYKELIYLYNNSSKFFDTIKELRSFNRYLFIHNKNFYLNIDPFDYYCGQFSREDLYTLKNLSSDNIVKKASFLNSTRTAAWNINNVNKYTIVEPDVKTSSLLKYKKSNPKHGFIYIMTFEEYLTTLNVYDLDCPALTILKQYYDLLVSKKYKHNISFSNLIVKESDKVIEKAKRNTFVTLSKVGKITFHGKRTKYSIEEINKNNLNIVLENEIEKDSIQYLFNVGYEFKDNKYFIFTVDDIEKRKLRFIKHITFSEFVRRNRRNLIRFTYKRIYAYFYDSYRKFVKNYYKLPKDPFKKIYYNRSGLTFETPPRNHYHWNYVSPSLESLLNTDMNSFVKNQFLKHKELHEDVSLYEYLYKKMKRIKYGNKI